MKVDEFDKMFAGLPASYFEDKTHWPSPESVRLGIHTAPAWSGVISFVQAARDFPLVPGTYMGRRIR